MIIPIYRVVTYSAYPTTDSDWQESSSSGMKLYRFEPWPEIDRVNEIGCRIIHTGGEVPARFVEVGQAELVEECQPPLCRHKLKFGGEKDIWRADQVWSHAEFHEEQGRRGKVWFTDQPLVSVSPIIRVEPPPIANGAARSQLGFGWVESEPAVRSPRLTSKERRAGHA